MISQTGLKRIAALQAFFISCLMAWALDVDAQVCGGPICGDGAPARYGAEECDDGNTVDGDGCSSVCTIEPGYDCTAAVSGHYEDDVLPNGGFDIYGQPPPGWDLIDHSLFGPNLICGDACFGGLFGSDGCGAPASGSYVLLVGGSFQKSSTGVAVHSPIEFPTDATELRFDWGTPASGPVGQPCAGPDDGMTLLIDDVEVWSNLDATSTCLNVGYYESVAIDLAALGLNDGEEHVIRFEGRATAVPPNIDLTMVFLDEIFLSVPAANVVPRVPSVCQPGPDPDGDGLTDSRDNCPLVANPAQLDSDFDGFGNACDNCTYRGNEDQTDGDSDGIGNLCDGDLNNDCIVNALDLGIFKSRLWTDDASADFSVDGIVNAVDLGLLRAWFFSPPGPSDTAIMCNE